MIIKDDFDFDFISIKNRIREIGVDFFKKAMEDLNIDLIKNEINGKREFSLYGKIFLNQKALDEVEEENSIGVYDPYFKPYRFDYNGLRCQTDDNMQYLFPTQQSWNYLILKKIKSIAIPSTRQNVQINSKYLSIFEPFFIKKIISIDDEPSLIYNNMKFIFIINDSIECIKIGNCDLVIDGFL